MAVRERHSSPDGSLVLVVDYTDGDLAVAFEGFEWHTHGDLLVDSYGATEHSPTGATGTGWERMPWHATQAGGVGGVEQG
jgi:hypothetical protein